MLAPSFRLVCATGRNPEAVGPSCERSDIVMKPITAYDIKSGDTIRLSGVGDTHIVTEVKRVNSQVVVTAGMTSKCVYVLQGAEVIILVRRPWMKGMTEEEMLRRIEHAIRAVARVGTLPSGKTFDLTIHQCGVQLDPFRDDDAMQALREAIEEYELGKPEEPTK
jgi:hypothetical protein